MVKNEQEALHTEQSATPNTKAVTTVTNVQAHNTREGAATLLPWACRHCPTSGSELNTEHARQTPELQVSGPNTQYRRRPRPSPSASEHLQGSKHMVPVE
ncbi:hypothetical protein E2C01_005163 [Portunus trituberculatus]|uniref:Uncharacterized protein n=1 Tax=Portunus trituberculatus TaxID=210409 RepID=A0A5B7CTA1_PORTR|nr:hypothetical protein [Portunus trituberculatus]